MNILIRIQYLPNYPCASLLGRFLLGSRNPQHFGRRHIFVCSSRSRSSPGSFVERGRSEYEMLCFSGVWSWELLHYNCQGIINGKCRCQKQPIAFCVSLLETVTFQLHPGGFTLNVCVNLSKIICDLRRNSTSKIRDSLILIVTTSEHWILCYVQYPLQIKEK